MRKTVSVMIAIICIAGNCYADTVKGTMEKVDIKDYSIVVNGNKVDVSKATIFSENDMNVVKNIIIRDLKDHKGETAVCYGSFNKDNTLIAYKVRVLEGHK